MFVGNRMDPDFPGSISAGWLVDMEVVCKDVVWFDMIVE